MKSENKRKMSLKWRIFIYLAVFTGVIILLMWLFQSVFLERIYKTVKIHEIEDAAEKIVAGIGNGTAGAAIDEAGESNICVAVVNMDGYGVPVAAYSSHVMNDCVIHTIDTESIFSLYDSAKENGGSQLQRFMYDSSTRKYIGLSGGFFDKSDAPGEDLPESIIYSVVTNDHDGNEMFVMLNSTISPVGATVHTLNMLLAVLTVILIILALILALIVSRGISRPITRLTGSAKELARGNYDVRFDGGGYREVTELSDALNYAESELAKTDTLRRELIANVSHDLRTPLTMMIGYGEMMRDIPGENTPENIQIVIDESKRLSSLVDDMVDISRLESGIGKNEPAPFDLSAAVGTTLERFAKLCEQENYSIEYYSVGVAWVNADEHRIMQAVYNLVVNALTHTGADRLVRVALTVNDGAARVSVADSGEGIPAEKLPLIWERYYRADEVHKRAAVGSGLGLSIVRRVMDQNGGTYGVSSEVGVGSEFWIELPLIEPVNGEEVNG